MKRKQSPKIYVGVIPEKRRNKLIALKNAIREGSYNVKAEDIAEKILTEQLFELALTFYNQKYQKCRNN